MKRQKHTEEQIIAILKEHEAGMKTAAAASRRRWAIEDVGAAFNARSALQLGGGVAKLSALNPNHPW
jgi:hypothetical protein